MELVRRASGSSTIWMEVMASSWACQVSITLMEFEETASATSEVGSIYDFRTALATISVHD